MNNWKSLFEATMKNPMIRNLLCVLAGCIAAVVAYWIISRPAFGELLPSAAPWMAAALHFVLGILWAHQKLSPPVEEKHQT